jgi:alpha/beta superfamily hydrolase
MTRRLPLMFDGCAGALHAGDAATGRAAVIVAPPGFEDLCSHRALDMLANMLAEAGVATLRYDPPGTGDSAGDAADPLPVDRWLASVAMAVGEAKRLTGVEDVALIGLRLGALLAAEAGARMGDISRMALLAPPASGKAYLRELKVLSRVIAPVAPPPPDLAPAPFDGFELAGFRLSRECVEGIASLRWLGEPPARVALNLAPGGAIPNDGALHVWEGEGVRVKRATFDGYEKMMCDPTATITPIAVLRDIVDFIREDAPAARAAAPRILTTTMTGDDWREDAIVFGDGNRLSGVLCRPIVGDDGHALIMANAGGVRRVGWGRQSVETARALAARGVTTFRMDFSNIAGVSGPDPAVPCHYGDDIHRELTAAMDALAGWGFGAFTLMGACSGAYHAVKAAVADHRARRVVSINQLCFEWGPQYALPLNAWMMQKAGDVARKRMAADENLSELARLRARLAARAMVVFKSNAKRAYRALRALAAMGGGSRDDHASSQPELDLLALSARGVRIDFVHADADPGIGELERWFGPGGERATALPGVTRAIIPAADHLLTPRHARAMLADILSDVPPNGARAEPLRAAS